GDSDRGEKTGRGTQNKALTLAKSVLPATYGHVGQLLAYSYVVTNTGNVSLAGPATVSDDKAAVSCPNVNTVGNLDGFLDPGEAVDCNASCLNIQADLNTGAVTNHATAHVGGTDSTTDQKTATATQNKSLTRANSVLPTMYDFATRRSSDLYVVTNTGNVSLAGPATVSDDKAAVSCPNVNTVGNLDGFLDPGEA